MNIGGIARTSTVDFPGRLSAVLFTNGCNYDCFYCHNRRLISGGAPLDNAEIDAFLNARAGLLDGIVVSGGEPTLQPDIAEFFLKLKRLGYDTKLDTNGSRPKVVSELIEKKLLDYVAMDYKAPFDMYKEICAQDADPEPVKQTLDILLGSGLDFELRTTVVPQLSPADLYRMAAAIPQVPRYILQPYKKPELYRREHIFRIEATPYTEAQLESMLESIREVQPNASLR
ncbi:MAG: anaerobic ribonucleoside-triphosphate reductase activating protein [Christensenellales bacterium]|jgi:pyruvate formate lyase activating enzyme